MNTGTPLQRPVLTRSPHVARDYNRKLQEQRAQRLVEKYRGRMDGSLTTRTMAATLTSLLKQTHIDDHDEILKSADSALKQSKGDLETQHVRVVALLKLDRFEDAIKALNAGGEKLKQQASLEYAYALYKTGKAKEAAEIAAKGAQRGYSHIEAQSRYRTEDFARAAELYKQLGASVEEDTEADLKVNASAVDALLEWSGRGELVRKKKPAREDLEAFETAYNAACGSIARGELGQGEVLLKRARDLCNAVEDMSDEDKEAEMLPIMVQQIYVLTRLGRLEEAEKLAHGVDAKSLPDASSRHIAQVNSIAASASLNNPYLAQRILSADLESLKPDYPFDFQTAILKQNQSAVDLQSMKFGGTASSTQASIAKQSGPTLDANINSLSAVNAAAHAKNQTGKEALKLILPLLEKRPDDVGLILTVVQLYVLTGNASSATTLLESFLSRLEQSGSNDIRYAPGMTGTIVSLYTTQNRLDQSRAEYAKAATFWRRKTKDQPSTSAGVTHFLKAAGSSLLESQDSSHQELARSIFQDLHAQDSSDRYSAAGLLATASPSDKDLDTSSLQPIDRLISGIDASALENAGIATLPKPATTTTLKRSADSDAQKPKKKKKLPASKQPKDFDPNKTPDPERWLPLRDRSTYRPKGKKGKARQAMFSQGAVATENENSRPGTPGGEVVKGKGGGGGGAGQGKKKKGKGNKW